MRKIQIVLTLFIAIGAVAGAVMIWILLEWWIFSFNAMSNIFFALALIELLTVKWNIVN